MSRQVEKLGAFWLENREESWSQPKTEHMESAVFATGVIQWDNE